MPIRRSSIGDGQKWDIITAGKHNDQPGTMLVVSALTQGCLNYDPRRKPGDQVNIFSCGGRADGGGAVTNSQLFNFTEITTGPLALQPGNEAGTCLTSGGARLDKAACNGGDVTQVFTFGKPENSVGGGADGGANTPDPQPTTPPTPPTTPETTPDDTTPDDTTGGGVIGGTPSNSTIPTAAFPEDGFTTIAAPTTTVAAVITEAPNGGAAAGDKPPVTVTATVTVTAGAGVGAGAGNGNGNGNGNGGRNGRNGRGRNGRGAAKAKKVARPAAKKNML
ncbi:hypothetical protein ABW20_dc0101819 [Dactylellina cionopaga]|nr:hypothetical protein ABW20_dc0101819 [Dactylellina cionopaga]